VTADDVKQIVLREIGERTTSGVGWEFRPFMLSEPELRSYGGENLWTVLIEHVDGAEGYHVIYDSDQGMFGLATGGVCIGLYGSFLETLDAM
jgi:hypothetical protein